MSESGEYKPSAESVEVLPPEIKRELLVVRGRSGLLIEPLDESLVANQGQFGKDTGDYASMVIVHQNNSMPGSTGTERFLGIHEEIRRKVRVAIDGKSTDFLEAVPESRNIWVGDYVKLFTPEEAAKMEYAGRKALDWAQSGGKAPEMVAKASDGYFYPATGKDIVVPAVKRR
ncbi:MAG: hypothetical protein M1405_00340 [Patescibacteria group bacterium]|nr:hypothetical protein [Patescibacteria group bacterium]